MPHSTPPSPARRASTIARTTALRSAAASMFGNESSSLPTLPPGVAGFAKSSTRALLGRDFSGYVLMPDRSNSSYENGIQHLVCVNGGWLRANSIVGLQRFEQDTGRVPGYAIRRLAPV